MKIQELNGTTEEFRPTIEQLLAFLYTQPLGSIASLSQDGRPQNARVAFSEHAGLQLVIGTATDSRKSLNMQRSAAVAFEVTDPEQRFTFQFEGTGELLTAETFEPFADAHFNKLPASAPFREIEGQCYYLLRPTWVRFSDCNPHPWVTTEDYIQ
jgi:hypothetical protein